VNKLRYPDEDSESDLVKTTVPVYSSRTRVRPLVSIVIPTRNRLHYLKEAVASVHAQTLGDWQLLIIDDASEDETASWLESMTDPRIEVVQMQRHVHRAGARNRGLSEASGELVIFLDDDDRFRSRALAVLARALHRHGELAIACGGRIEFDDAGQHRRSPNVRRSQVRALWPEILGGWVAGTGQVMFRTEALREIGGWDESLIAWQDVELLWRASRRLGPVFVDPYVVREYRKHPEQWVVRDRWEGLARLEESFVESLPPHERAIGEGAVRMRVLLREARETLHRHDEPGKAMRLFLAAYRSAPALARSPMFRPGFIRGLSQAFLAHAGGPRAHRMLESFRRRLLHILHRTPGRTFRFKNRIVDEPTIRDEAHE
jgi:glycosyltransferase involved in cell wall biosynthesis